MLPSAQYRRYRRLALPQLLGCQWRLQGKISLCARYWLPDRRRPDLLNLLQATADILEEAGVIANDRDIISLNGSCIAGIDKQNPRVEITLTVEES